MHAFERVKKFSVRWLSADASFEASLREAPQDEDFFAAVAGTPHAESL